MGNNLSENVQRPFPFMELPGEIRNKVYQYALTTDTGQVAVTLPMHAVAAAARNLRYPMWRIQKHDLSEFAAELRVSQTTSLFRSRLPFISEYTSRRTSLPGISHRQSSAEQDVNQLKFVCRQLRAETLCLELQYNSLAFLQRTDSAPASYDQMVFFKQLSPRSVFNWVTTIEIHTLPVEMHTFVYQYLPMSAREVVALTRINKFANQNPNIKIRYTIHLPDSSQPSWSILDHRDNVSYIIAQSVALRMALRNQQQQEFARLHLSVWQNIEVDASLVLFRQRFAPVVVGPNIRFFPGMVAFDSEKYREEANGYDPAHVDRWVKHIEEWIETGF